MKIWWVIKIRLLMLTFDKELMELKLMVSTKLEANVRYNTRLFS